MKKSTLKYVAVCAVALTAVTATAPAVTTLLGEGATTAQAAEQSVEARAIEAAFNSDSDILGGAFQASDATFLTNSESEGTVVENLLPIFKNGQSNLYVAVATAYKAIAKDSTDVSTPTKAKAYLATKNIDKVMVNLDTNQDADAYLKTLNGLAASKVVTFKIAAYQSVPVDGGKTKDVNVGEAKLQFTVKNPTLEATDVTKTLEDSYASGYKLKDFDGVDLKVSEATIAAGLYKGYRKVTKSNVDASGHTVHTVVGLIELGGASANLNGYFGPVGERKETFKFVRLNKELPIADLATATVDAVNVDTTNTVIKTYTLEAARTATVTATAATTPIITLIDPSKPAETVDNNAGRVIYENGSTIPLLGSTTIKVNDSAATKATISKIIYNAVQPYNVSGKYTTTVNELELLNAKAQLVYEEVRQPKLQAAADSAKKAYDTAVQDEVTATTAATTANGTFVTAQGAVTSSKTAAEAAAKTEAETAYDATNGAGAFAALAADKQDELTTAVIEAAIKAGTSMSSAINTYVINLQARDTAQAALNAANEAKTAAAKTTATKLEAKTAADKDLAAVNANIVKYEALVKALEAGTTTPVESDANKRYVARAGYADTPLYYTNETANVTPAKTVVNSSALTDVNLDEVDTTKAGLYYATITVTSTAGVSSTFRVPVSIVDTEGPAFVFSNLLPQNPIVEAGAGFNLAEYDLYTDSSLTTPLSKDNVKVLGTVDLTKVGVYTLTYTATNPVNGKSSTVTRTVTVTNPTTATKVQLYRAYNPNSGEHLFTADRAEYDKLIGLGWEAEGGAWTAVSTGTAIYRLYNPNSGEHFYTTDEAEYNNVAAAGWTKEGVVFYSNDAKTVPVYRLFNPNAKGAGSHHYTTSVTERDSLVSVGWTAEGIAFYGA